MRCRSAVILAVLLVLPACASVPPKQFVRVNPDFESKISEAARVAVIADVCLLRDVLGDDDYWVVQESRTAAELMVDSAKNHLEDKGYQVSYVGVPFVGGFKNREKPFKVCDIVGGEIMEKNPPLFESEGLAENPAYRDALLEIIPKIPASQSRKTSPPDVCCSNENLKDQLITVARNTGGDTTLFLIGNGTIVSAGKQLTQGLTTGLLTAALTLGTVSVSHYNVSVLVTYAVLVDNRTGEILWSNSMRLKGDGFTDKAYYDVDRWPRNILYHMPSKTGAERNSKMER